MNEHHYFEAPAGAGQVHYRLCRPRAAAGRPGLAPILLLHPTPKSGWIYETLMPLLAAQGRLVIAPDTPGYGASEPPPAEPSIEGYALTMLALAKALAGEEPIDILGYHTGSSIAAQMALQAPGRVRKLMLFSIAAYDAEVRAQKLATLSQSAARLPDGAHLARMWDIVASLCDERADTTWRARSVAENLRAHDMPAGYRAVYRHDLQAALRQLGHPVLLVNCEDDLWDLTRANRHLVPHARYTEMPGTRHGLFTFAAEPIANMLGEFLD